MALNCEEIGKNLQRIFEKNDLTIDLNVLYAKKEKIYPAYVLKHNSKCEKKGVFFNDSKPRWNLLYFNK